MSLAGKQSIEVHGAYIPRVHAVGKLREGYDRSTGEGWEYTLHDQARDKCTFHRAMGMGWECSQALHSGQGIGL